MTSTARLALPPEHPLEMPRQTLNARGQRDRAPFRLWEDGKFWLARLVLVLATWQLSVYGIQEMHEVMTGELTQTQWVFLVLFSINFVWISFAGCQAVLGFLLLIAVDLFGHHALGAQRWLQFGPIQIQPSEIAKLSLSVRGYTPNGRRHNVRRNGLLGIGKIAEENQIRHKTNDNKRRQAGQGLG